MREKIFNLLNEVGKDYQEKGMYSEVRGAHDVHAYYYVFHYAGNIKDLSTVPKVVHVQGYPGLSSGDKMHVWARLMDFQKMLDLRTIGKCSIGNEHGAVVQNFPNFGIGVQIPYDAEVLKKMLTENVPELGGRK